MLNKMKACIAITALGLIGCAVAAPDILIADFEGNDYGKWDVRGEAFGAAPARGAFEGQMEVKGYQGKGLVNSYLGGDGATGELVSPKFEIKRSYINFLIGGGGYAEETRIDLVIDGAVVQTATGGNTSPGGSERLTPASWDVAEYLGQKARIRIVDQRRGGWGHINVDHIVQSEAGLYRAEAKLTVAGSHLLVPVSNRKEDTVRIGIYQKDRMIQDFKVSLPRESESGWVAAYPVNGLELEAGEVTLRPVGTEYLPREMITAFERIQFGDDLPKELSGDYAKPYRNQFHPSTRRGWNNDPNGMVYHDGKYHLYYQYNPFGIFWGNMHWGHFVSEDLIHWREEPIALFQNTTKDMMFSGGGFVDFNDSAGLGSNTLFVAFTSTGRGECLAYSRDRGCSFTELPENPVVKHKGRDPKIIWYEPERKWVMAVYDTSECDETRAVPQMPNQKRCTYANMAFYESRDLRVWKRTGAFTDPDRIAVHECPELFELTAGDESRWILYGAWNRYFIGHFDGKTFVKESGPHGSRHGAFYAAQTFSDEPNGRRVQIGWVQTRNYPARYPDQLTNQAFTLPHEMTLVKTEAGLRLAYNPVHEVEKLRDGELAGLEDCRGELTEVLVEFEEGGKHEVMINGIDASFEGRSARIFTDRTFNEVYADGGLYYEVRTREDLDSTEIRLGEGTVKSFKAYRLKSIWR